MTWLLCNVHKNYKDIKKIAHVLIINTIPD